MVSPLIDQFFSVGFREYRVEIQDIKFQPAVIVIQQGDRVWWGWDKLRVSASNVLGVRGDTWDYRKNRKLNSELNVYIAFE